MWSMEDESSGLLLGYFLLPTYLASGCLAGWLAWCAAVATPSLAHEGHGKRKKANLKSLYERSEE